MQRRTFEKARSTAGVSALSASAKCIASVCEAIDEKPLMYLSKRGTIGVNVSDDQSFTIRFGDRARPLDIENADENADLRLELTSAILGRIIDGTIDAPAELAAGTLKIAGRFELLVELCQMLERGTSLLAIRANKSR